MEYVKGRKYEIENKRGGACASKRLAFSENGRYLGLVDCKRIGRFAVYDFYFGKNGKPTIVHVKSYVCRGCLRQIRENRQEARAEALAS